MYEIMKNYQIRLWAIIALQFLFLVIFFDGVSAVDDFQSLIGRWQRPDGGYILEIRRIDAEGKILAGYYNPRPINVSHALASIYKGYIKVEVELRDAGYPGSHYTLVYDRATDRLLGLYYHAISKRKFEVVFVRQK